MKKLSVLFIITAGVLWGCMGVFSGELQKLGFNSVEGSAIRLIFCAVILALTNFNKLKIKLKDIWMFALIGIASILTMSITYFESIKRSSLTIASILLYTAPVMVTLMSAIFYKEKLTTKKLISLTAAISGIILISGFDTSSPITTSGLVFGLLSGFSYALYSIIGKYILKKYEPITVSAYAFIFASVGVLFMCNIPSMADRIIKSSDIMYTLLIMLGCGVITAAIPYTLYTLGLKYIPAGKASILACVEPLTATVIGISFYGDKLGLTSICGIILIFFGVSLLSLSKNTQ